MKNTILFGDCRDTLPTIDVKARMCVTSPPYYGLRNYGGEENQIGQEDTPEQVIDNLVSVFRSVRDVLTDDGTLWVNIGDSYGSRGLGDVYKRQPKKPWPQLGFQLAAVHTQRGYKGGTIWSYQ